MQERIAWQDLPVEVRDAVITYTGAIDRVNTVSEGKNSPLAVIMYTANGTMFVKGLRTDHPGVVTQQREAVINPFVRPFAPAVLWHVDDIAGWNVLAFEYVKGRHADFAPGSVDLPAVVDVMCALGELRCPDVEQVKDARKRWTAYLDRPTAAELFGGDTLLFTDYNPANILIPPSGMARVIDWAWPTRGAAWIDPCWLLVRLIAAGHTPHQAEAWVQQSPAWRSAPEGALDMFAVVSARLWQDIADNTPQPWTLRMTTAAREWSDARLTGSHT